MAQSDQVSSTALAGAMGPHVLVSLPAASAPPNQRLRLAGRPARLCHVLAHRRTRVSLGGWSPALYPPLVDAFETQVTHPKWQGFVAWDMVMPVFLFLVGTSMPFALAKRLRAGRAAVVRPTGGSLAAWPCCGFSA